MGGAATGRRGLVPSAHGVACGAGGFRSGSRARAGLLLSRPPETRGKWRIRFVLVLDPA